MTIQKGASVYFLGIGGTGMASVAGLAQQAGYQVVGSDTNLYPPMSTMLEELKIPVYTPYDPANLKRKDIDLFIVANALSRGHIELEAMLESGKPYTSFPAFLGEYFLSQRQTVVVAGTHGKTTTTSLFAYLAQQLAWEPGYLIGGIPRDFPRSFDIGKGPLFVIEGDEYDTAYFDKNAKFLHYCPQFLILNNIEFDHADIFADLAAVEAQFRMLIEKVKNPRCIIANVDDPGVEKLLKSLGIENKVTRVATAGQHPNAHVRLEKLQAPTQGSHWQLTIQTRDGQKRQMQTLLAGPHNAANICQIIACIDLLQEMGVVPARRFDDIALAMARFQGVKRRLDRLSSHAGVDVFEDFAHHPTAVKAVIESLRTLYPKRRLLVAFEPRNATSRRNTFLKEFAQSLSLADRIYIGACPVDHRIPEEQRMSTSQMAELIGASAQAFQDNEALLDTLVQDTQSEDTIVFMSSGSFSGIQYRMGERLSQLGR